MHKELKGLGPWAGSENESSSRRGREKRGDTS